MGVFRRIVIREGEQSPSFFYCLAYHDYYRRQGYWYIFPVAYAVRLWRLLRFYWDRFRSRPTFLDRQAQEMFDYLMAHQRRISDEIDWILLRLARGEEEGEKEERSVEGGEAQE